MNNLEKWHYYWKDLESPDMFITMTFYWMVSATLQRRVFTGSNEVPIYPNEYIVFVGPPGVGKSMAARYAGYKVLKTFTRVDPNTRIGTVPLVIHDIPFSADDTTLQSLIRQLGNATRTYEYDYLKQDGSGETIKKTAAHASLTMLLSEELTSLFHDDNRRMSSFLCQCYDAQDYDYQVKTEGKSDMVKNVCVNLLGCTTPKNMKDLMATKILQEGFGARTIFVYEDKSRHRRADIEFNDDQKTAFSEMYLHLKKLKDIQGRVTFTDEAKEWFRKWYEDGEIDSDRINKSPLLDLYYARKKLHLKKMAMACHFADSLSMTIGIESYIKANFLLKQVEPKMHLALASTSRNELFDFTMDMLKWIKDSKDKGVTRNQIRMMFASNLTEDEQTTCLKYLQETYMIRPPETSEADGKQYYKAINTV